MDEGIISGPLRKYNKNGEPMNILEPTYELKKNNTTSMEVPPELELKKLPTYLQYAYLEAGQKFPVIIATDLSDEQKCQLLELLKIHKKSIAWKIFDIKGINPTICMHIILLEDNAKNNIEIQRRLNPTTKEVVKKEIIKWLDARIIYPILDSVWVNPIKCFPKKGDMIVIEN